MKKLFLLIPLILSLGACSLSRTPINNNSSKESVLISEEISSENISSSNNSSSELSSSEYTSSSNESSLESSNEFSSELSLEPSSELSSEYISKEESDMISEIIDSSEESEAMSSEISEEVSLESSSYEPSSEQHTSSEPSSFYSSENALINIVPSSYFKCLSYVTYQMNDINYLRIDFECPFDIDRVDYSFKIYQNDGELIGSVYEGELEAIDIDGGFSFIYPGIDNNTYQNCGFINFLSLSGETEDEIMGEEYKHQIKFHNKDSIETFNVSSGEKINEIETSLESNNIKLEGWYLENNYQTKFNFDEYYIYHDIDLYPHYVLDEEAFDEDVRKNFLTSNMVIFNTCYNKSYFIITEETVVTGSGVVVKRENGYTYVLTNCHVVSLMDGYKYSSYTVKDVYNSTYTASLIYSDPNYDLALLRIRTRFNKNYYVPTFAKEDPEIGDYVAAVGEPNGEYNTITLGEVTKYQTVELSSEDKESSNVEFSVITHSAETNHGSSGGALLDTNLNLVGINYAGATTVEDNIFIESYAIPIEKVKEFCITAYSQI